MKIKQFAFEDGTFYVLDEDGRLWRELCDLCDKPVVVAGWVLDRDPKKQKTHYHIDCLIQLADKTIKKELREK